MGAGAPAQLRISNPRRQHTSIAVLGKEGHFDGANQCVGIFSVRKL